MARWFREHDAPPADMFEARDVYLIRRIDDDGRGVPGSEMVRILDDYDSLCFYLKVWGAEIYGPIKWEKN